ncbi:MAG: acetyl-CoA carboxylase biotin carboxyl carrier protein subunit [Flavobacteriales bacterium]|nr:acetyl-CoA carboxylase biotin carboxyl carrier protein subunit [Flavobacteriales bacterium]
MDEIKVISEDKKEYQISFDTNLNSGQINSEQFNWDIVSINERTFHVLKNNKSYNVELLKVNFDEKNYFIKINGKKFKFTVQDKYDQLLKSLGLDSMAATKVLNVKAPMPGLVINIAVEVGQTVQKGDTLLILEAMKMENVIKSPTDGVIKSIVIKKGDAVEKNQVLINF